MMGLERDILYLISRVRCVTENQVGKVFNNKKRSGKKSLKRTLRKMCNDYTLRKFPTSINYTNFKDTSGVYYLNGSSITRDNNLTKILLGSEIAIRLNTAGYEIIRFYRNVNVGNKTYDIFIEYINEEKQRTQVLIDIKLEGKTVTSKYDNIVYDIEKSTIPFFMVPKILVITSKEFNMNKIVLNENVYLIDMSLNKLFKYL